jgi:hypothetical protein
MSACMSRGALTRPQYAAQPAVTARDSCWSCSCAGKSPCKLQVAPGVHGVLASMGSCQARAVPMSAVRSHDPTMLSHPAVWQGTEMAPPAS